MFPSSKSNGELPGGEHDKFSRLSGDVDDCKCGGAWIGYSPATEKEGQSLWGLEKMNIVVEDQTFCRLFSSAFSMGFPHANTFTLGCWLVNVPFW